MNTKAFVEALIATANKFDTEAYLANWEKDAILNDPSVGEIFKGQKGIRRYFEAYFIGYKTQTRLLMIKPINENEVYVEVEFTGNFPGGKTKGMFEFTFNNNRISRAKADLL